MRILHVIPGLSPRDGGPTNALHGMARATASLGAQVTVVTSDDDMHGVPLARPIAIAGVDYWYFRRTLPGSWKASIGLARWLSANIARYDVVHVHALFSFSTIPGCRYAFRDGVPVVLRPLGTIAPWSMSHRGWKKRPYYALIERSHVARASAIHVTSEAELDAVSVLGAGVRARVIPLGVDIAPTPLKAVSRSDAPLRLLFLARLHPVKALPVLLRAVAIALRNGTALELSIAGEGAPDYRAQLDAVVAELGLERFIKFHGHVDGELKKHLLADADAYVLPSYQENFGVAAAEALAAGLPVIVSDHVGIAPAIRTGEAGLVVRVDEEELAGAIQLLAREPALRERMGINARRLATEAYSWHRTATSLMALYEELRAGRGRKGSSG